MFEPAQSLFEQSLSDKTGPLESRVQEFKNKYKQLWLQTDTTYPVFSKTYSRKEKRRIESETTKFLDELLEKQKNHSIEELDKNAFLKEKEPEIVRFCNLAGLYMDKDFSRGFDRSTKVFREKVEKFDPTMKPENIYQAMRNVWIMNSLQVLIEREMNCSDSMFAYSMLYPYSDNVNDDISMTVEDKLKMNHNFRQWLEGEKPPYRNDVEKKIFLLVSMIEKQFPRSQFPGVFQSLLAIFNAQIRSLVQQKQKNGTDILNISLEKGGTSVLADGYLLNGMTDDKLEDFCFGYGVFLQFADDIQDVDVDTENGHLTLFSQFVQKDHLDMIANKLFNYMLNIVDMHLSVPNHQRLRELILQNCYFMVLEAIGKNSKFYTKKYIQNIESQFPFSFLFFRSVKKKLKRLILEADERGK